MDHTANVQRGLAWISETYPNVVLTTHGLDMSDSRYCVASQLPGGYLGVLRSEGGQFCVDHGFLIEEDSTIPWAEYDRLADAWRAALAAER